MSCGPTAGLPHMTTVQPLAGRREWVGLGVVTLACLLYVMDLTVLHVAIPQISEDLHPSGTQLLWIIDGYGFTVAGTLVTMGTLGDRIGRRRLLMIGAAAFGAVSLLAAFATSAEMLIAARMLLGVAGATIAPSTLSLIFHMFKDARQRSLAVGVWIGAFSAGSAVGPVLGGLVLASHRWGAVFLLALPVMAALLVLGPVVLPEYRDPGTGRLDPLSAAMSIAAVLAVVYGIKQVAADGPTVGALGAAALGALVGAAWVRRQRHSADPMIDVRLFANRQFAAALLVNLMAFFVMVGDFLFFAQYLQLVAGLSPLHAGLWSLPSAAGFVVASQLAPRFLAKVRPELTVAGGLAVAVVGLLMLTRVGTDGVGTLVAASTVIALGLGPVIGLITELVVGAAPAEKAGAASGISETAAELGAALGIAVLGSVAMAIYRAGLPAGAPQTARDTLGGAVAVGDPALADAARAAFVTGLTVTSAIGAVLGLALAIVAAVALRPAHADGVAQAPTTTAADAATACATSIAAAAPAAGDATADADGATPELCPC
jgi:MFS transporter, DHA2 family, multidrug resistance protein